MQKHAQSVFPSPLSRTPKVASAFVPREHGGDPPRSAQPRVDEDNMVAKSCFSILSPSPFQTRNISIIIGLAGIIVHRVVQM